MKKVVIFPVCFLIWVCVLTNLFADETITVVTHPIPLAVVDNRTGVMVELTNSIAEKAGIRLHITVFPPLRAIRSFLDKDFDMLFPGLDVYFSPDDELIKTSESITVKEDFIFNLKGEPLLKTVQELEGKKVGITLGYPYSKELLENDRIEFEAVWSDEINARKLLAGRIDAFVVEERTGIKAFQNEGMLGKVQYDDTFILTRHRVYYAFQDTKKGRRLAQLFTQTLSDMKKDGTYQEIMKKADKPGSVSTQ